MTNLSGSTVEGSTVDVGKIERELTSLWQQASMDEDGGVIRSSTANLVIYVSGEFDTASLDDLIADITATHPCRAIVIVVDHDQQQSSMNAQVTSRCTLPTATSKQVCCEQVSLTASGARINEVPSAVAPLLVSDLPVFLWWRAVPSLQDKVFSRLVDLSDRVVIDSARFNDPARDLAALARILRDTPRWTAVSDLNWARLTAWRALLAGFYDVREYRTLLDHLSCVLIEHSPCQITGAPVSARALVLGGWLASRLGWKLLERNNASGSSHQFIFEANGRRITMEFRPTTRKIEPGRISAVTFETSAGRPAYFKVRRSTDSTRIETTATLDERMRGQRVLSYESLSESALLTKELDILGHDRVYEQAVLGAADLLSNAP
jgi:glucose-6-phosphate dehydrogenase assembly protein OpcA